MSPQDAYECAKDFARAFPRATRGDFCQVVKAADGGHDFKLTTPGRLFLESLLPMRITRQQFDAMLRECAATESNWAKAKVKLLAMARAASRQVWIDKTQSPAAVGAGLVPADRSRAADDGCEQWAAGEVPHRPGETVAGYAMRLLRDHRDAMSDEEIENVEAFVSLRHSHVRPGSAAGGGA